MAAVRLSTVWLNVVDDPADRLVLPTMVSLQATTTRPGEVRTGAGGIRRVIVGEGTPRTYSLSAVGLEREDIAWLEDHASLRLVVRDDRGRKIIGTYFAVPVDEHPYDERGDITLSIEAA